jgi:hypothetical protein
VQWKISVLYFKVRRSLKFIWKNLNRLGPLVSGSFTVQPGNPVTRSRPRPPQGQSPPFSPTRALSPLCSLSPPPSPLLMGATTDRRSPLTSVPRIRTTVASSSARATVSLPSLHHRPPSSVVDRSSRRYCKHHTSPQFIYDPIITTVDLPSGSSPLFPTGRPTPSWTTLSGESLPALHSKLEPS